MTYCSKHKLPFLRDASALRAAECRCVRFWETQEAEIRGEAEKAYCAQDDP